MALLINPTEQSLVDSIQSDSVSMQQNGISIDTDGNGTGDTAYCTNLPLPTPNYDIIVPPGSTTDLKVRDGFRAMAAPIIRRIMPIGWQVNNLNPSFNFTAGTDLLTFNIPATERLNVARNVQAVFTSSMWTDVAGTVVLYFLEINGSSTGLLRNFFFNQVNTHTTLSSTWLVSIPSGAVTIKVRAVRFSGTGNIKLDGNDHLSLTIIG